ncbi:MAG: hypothetical protein KF773_03050 [Deltaproteobacteria bacterium]|nr:hypothetical protein [Deltaproteobacteria bacterium]
MQYAVTENGVVEQAVDMTSIAIAEPEYAPDWREVRAQNGTRSVERHFLPRTNPLDLSFYSFGRAGRTFPTKTTQVGVEVDGLSPWVNGDTLQVVAPNVGLSIMGLDAHFTYPEVGATAVANRTVNWRAAESPLIDAARGDVTTWVAQMSFSVEQGTSTLTRSGVARGFVVRDGESSTLSATLQPVAQDRRFGLRWHGDEFAALAAQAGAGVRAASQPQVTVQALPAAVAGVNQFHRSAYGYLPTLVSVLGLTGDQFRDRTIPYGNPFTTAGARWTELVTTVYAMPATIRGFGSMTARVMQATPLAGRTEVDLAPVLSPVRDVQIDGRAATEPLAGVGTTPTLTWLAPAVGTPTGYEVTVYEAVTVGDSRRINKVATFYTRGTKLDVPATVLDRSPVVFNITAVMSPGRDRAKTPFQGSLPFASTDYLTSVVVP